MACAFDVRRLTLGSAGPDEGLGHISAVAEECDPPATGRPRFMVGRQDGREGKDIVAKEKKRRYGQLSPSRGPPSVTERV